MPSRAMSAHVRGFWTGRMVDTVVWQQRIAGEPNEVGAIAYTWPDTETLQGDFEFPTSSQEDEQHLSALTEVHLVAKLRVPLVRRFDLADRIKLTHRGGYQLPDAITFEIKSTQRIGSFVQELLLQMVSN